MLSPDLGCTPASRVRPSCKTWKPSRSSGRSPGWRAHQLTGDRQGTWSLRVTGNWRLTFRVEAGDLVEVNYEDYHG